MNTKAQNLPLLLRHIHDTGGIDAVLALTKAFGGKRVFIPSRPVGVHHPLAIAGEKVAQMLVDEFGGEHVEFTAGRAYVRLLIARKVIAEKGSNNEIADAAGVSWRRAKQLRRMIRKGKTTPTQGRPRIRDDRQIDIEDLLK